LNILFLKIETINARRELKFEDGCIVKKSVKKTQIITTIQRHDPLSIICEILFEEGMEFIRELS
jgi:hypothetical protein